MVPNFIFGDGYIFENGCGLGGIAVSGLKATVTLVFVVRQTLLFAKYILVSLALCVCQIRQHFTPQ